MAITFVNSVQYNDKTPPFDLSLNLPAFSCSANNLVVVGICAADSPIVVTDTAGNTYLKADNLAVTNRGNAEVWYCLNTTANASNVINITTPAGGYYGVCAVQYTSGNANGFAFDATAKGTGVGSTSITSSAFTTTVADEVILAYATQADATASFTAGSGYTIRSTSTSGTDAIQEKVVSEIQTSVTSTMTSNKTTGFGILVATFYNISTVTVAPPALAVTATLNAPTLTLINAMSVLAPVLNIVATLNAPSLIIGIWNNIQKSVTSWTNSSKNSTTWTDQSKNSTTWTNRNKS